MWCSVIRVQADTPYKEKVNPLGQKINPHDPRIEAMGKDFFNQPVHCQKAAIERIDLQSLFPSTEDNPQGVSAPPGSTDGGSSGGGSEGMPVNPTTTSKPTGHGGSRSINPSQMPSADGCSYDSDGRPSCAVKSEGSDENPIADNNAENGGDDNKWVPLPSHFKEQIEERLKTGDCNAWIANLISKAYEIGNRKRKLQYKDSVPEDLKPFAKDGLEALQNVTKQNGFLLVPFLKVGGLSAAGTVSGSMGNGTSQVQIRAFPLVIIWGNEDTTYRATQIYITTVIHELVHAAGVFNGDSEIADTLVEMGLLKVTRDRKSFKTEAEYQLARSGDWGQLLLEHCGDEYARKESK